MKTLVLCVKDKYFFHKNSLFLCIKYCGLFTISSCWRLLYRFKTVLSHGFLIWFADWYMYVYIYWEKTLSCNRLVIWFQREMTWSWPTYFCLTVWFYIFGAKWLCHDAHTFIGSVLTSVWKWHTLFMYSINGIEETTSSKKTSIMWYRGNEHSQ